MIKKVKLRLRDIKNLDSLVSEYSRTIAAQIIIITCFKFQVNELTNFRCSLPYECDSYFSIDPCDNGVINLISL